MRLPHDSSVIHPSLLRIFIDGLNNFSLYTDEPVFTKRLKKFMDSQGQPLSTPELLSHLLNKMPIGRVINYIRYHLSKYTQAKQVHINFEIDYDSTSHSRVLINDITNRYFANMFMIESISAAYHVKPIFIFHPIPDYKYDLDRHPFANRNFKNNKSHYILKYGYQHVKKELESKPQKLNFLWCADIQEQLSEPLYVDEYHYSSKMSAKLAQMIFDMLHKRQLLFFTDD